MKRFYANPAIAVVAALGWASMAPARAAPPTVTPSPGYDARLQEQKAAPPVHEPVAHAIPATASNYAGEISAYRRAHGLSAVRLDSRLNAVALQQARAMALSGTVSHSAGGNFSTRVAGLRKTLAGENIGAGFRSFAEMLKQWEDSAGHRENLLMTGARKIGVASVDNPKSPYGRFWAMVITD
jgi:uncharacterized protein YkwD